MRRLAAAVCLGLVLCAASCSAKAPEGSEVREHSSVSSTAPENGSETEDNDMSVNEKEKPEIASSSPESSEDTTKAECARFRRVCCIGDSFTAGFTFDSRGNATETNEDLAWPHYMSELTGCEYINCGKSGATAESWLYTPRGLDKARQSGRVDAYIIGLGLNDACDDPGLRLEVGSAEDIGTETVSYYGSMSRIIREVHQISPDAYIFMQTIPTGEDGTYDAKRYDPYNNAIREICAQYEKEYNTRLLDLEKYKDRYINNKVLHDNAIGGHYYPKGYREFALLLFDIWNEYLSGHSEISVSE